MGRSADIKTKAVATRVPMADYIKILQESSAKGISVSDYVSARLSMENKFETGGGIPVFKDKIVEKEVFVDKKETTELVKNLKNKVSTLESEISALKSKKTTNKGIEELLQKLFSINDKSFAVINEQKNPYFDIVNEIKKACV